MCCDCRYGWVGEVVGRYVDSLDRSHRYVPDRDDTLLQSRDLARKRRLITNPRWQAAKQARHFRTGLDEAKDVVHQQQDVLVTLVAVVFRDGQRGKRHAPARTWRLVHLAIDEHGPPEND